MAVPCVKNHYGRTYFDELMPTCLRGAVEIELWETLSLRRAPLCWPSELQFWVLQERNTRAVSFVAGVKGPTWSWVSSDRPEGWLVQCTACPTCVTSTAFVTSSTTDWRRDTSTSSKTTRFAWSTEPRPHDCRHSRFISPTIGFASTQILFFPFFHFLTP